MAMQKCSACRGGCDDRSDLRCYALQQLHEVSVELALKYLYPALMDLTHMPEDWDPPPHLTHRPAPSPATLIRCPSPWRCAAPTT